MTTIELAGRVVAEQTAHLWRYRDGALQARPYHARGRKRGWATLDLFSAGAIVAVADALNDENRAKLARIPPSQAARVCLALCK